MAKLKREAYGLYIRFKSTDDWFLIGSGIDSLSVEMNGSFEQKKDIIGAVAVTDTGYTPQISVEPYIANPDDDIYTYLKDIAMNRKSGDDAKAEYLEVIIDDTSASSHSAWTEDCRVEISSYGGDTTGHQINYNIWVDGNRKAGTVAFTGKVPSFTANS